MPDPTSTPISDDGKSGLTAGAKVGIGVGVGLGVLFIAAAALFWFWTIRKKRRATIDNDLPVLNKEGNNSNTASRRDIDDDLGEFRGS